MKNLYAYGCRAIATAVMALSGLGMATAQAQPTFDIYPGTTGTGNDHASFTAAETFIQGNPGGAKLIIHAGNYTVGLQSGPGANNSYNGDDVLSLANCRNVEIEGDGPVNIQFENGLKFGRIGGTNYGPGHFLYLSNCTGVTIRNLTVNGNSDQFDFGDPTESITNTQMEGANDGIFLMNTRDVTVSEVSMTHMGRDGIQAKFSDGQYTPTSAPMNLTLTNCHFDDNGRDGFSWVAGSGVVVTNCTFNRQGQGVIKAGLKAGIDIEPEGGNYLWDGLFTNCEFVNNFVTGVLADMVYGMAEQAQHVQFVGCTISGNQHPTGVGAAIWATRPYFTFTGCTVYGEVRRPYGASIDDAALHFNRCAFTDSPLNGHVTTNEMLVQAYHQAERALFNDCDFTIHTYGHTFVYVDNLGDAPVDYVQFKDCRFHTAYATQTAPGPDLPRAKFTNVAFKGNCRFIDETNFTPKRVSRATTPYKSTAAYRQNPIYSMWPVDVTGTLTLGGGPDIRYMLDFDTFTIKPGGTVNVNDGNELIAYGSSTLQIDQGATLAVNAGGQLSTIGGGAIHVDGTLIVRTDGWFCADWGSGSVVVGPTGRIIYEPGARVPEADPLRYPYLIEDDGSLPATNKNCQGTPLNNDFAVALSQPTVVAKLDDTYRYSAAATITGGTAPYNVFWEVDFGQGYAPLSNSSTSSSSTRASITRTGPTSTPVSFRVTVVDSSPYHFQLIKEASTFSSSSRWAPQAYPNPANAFLDVVVGERALTRATPQQATDQPQAVPTEVRFYDHMGKLQHSVVVNGKEAGQGQNEQLRVNTAKWAAGLYYMRTHVNGQVITRTIEIQH
jgi:hypothetical protein